LIVFGARLTYAKIRNERFFLGRLDKVGDAGRNVVLTIINVSLNNHRETPLFARIFTFWRPANFRPPSLCRLPQALTQMPLSLSLVQVNITGEIETRHDCVTSFFFGAAGEKGIIKQSCKQSTVDAGPLKGLLLGDTTKYWNAQTNPQLIT